jgi:hypothetical protein
MRKRLAAAVAATALTAGSLLALAGTASADAQTLPDVHVSLMCGPVTSTVDTSVTGGDAGTTGSVSVSIIGLDFSVPIPLNSLGSGLAALPLPTVLLDVLPQLPVTVTVDGTSQTIDVPVNCGML